MKKTSFSPGLLIWIGTLGAMTLLRGQGNLTPPGPPAPSMKTLDQIEPRSLISSAPFTITNSGSFYLATNLTGAPGQSGIIVRADHVTLDLNGFALIGVPGSSNGIFCPNALNNLVIRNGTIRNRDASGVEASAAGNGRIADLRVSANGARGIAAGLNTLLEACTTTSNGDDGIQAGDRCTLKHCVASQNNGNGILANSNTLLENCSAAKNSADGFRAGIGCTLKGCLASQNIGTGIVTDAGNNLIDCSAQGNQLDGIDCATESRASGCLARQNGRHGFSIGDRVHIDNCDVQSNQSRGIDSGAGLVARASLVANNLGGGIFAGAASHVTDCQAISNQGTGINAGDGSTVSHCTADNNGGNGILVTTECRITGNNSHANTRTLNSAGIYATGAKNQIIDNSATSNDFGIRLDSDGNFEVRNVVGNNTVNYFGSTNQIRGPILTTLNDPTTSTQPWANFDISSAP